MGKVKLWFMGMLVMVGKKAKEIIATPERTMGCLSGSEGTVVGRTPGTGCAVSGLHA